jgi:hypothetical protein
MKWRSREGHREYIITRLDCLRVVAVRVDNSLFCYFPTRFHMNLPESRRASPAATALYSIRIITITPPACVDSMAVTKRLYTHLKLA